jgi:GntR family transcriptional regulator
MGKKDILANTPLYMSIRQSLLESIRSGAIVQNGRLPSEEALAKKFGVSRSTIRSSLNSLEKNGVIIRKQGVGTFVNEEGLRAKMRIDVIKGFFQLIRDSGHVPSIKESKLEFLTLDDGLSKILGLGEAREALYLQRLFLGNGKPAIFLKEYIPLSVLKRVPKIYEIPESIFEFAETFCRTGIEYSLMEIQPILPNKELMSKMSLRPNEPLLELEETHYNKENQPLILSSLYVNDKIIRFQVLRRRSQ